MRIAVRLSMLVGFLGWVSAMAEFIEYLICNEINPLPLGVPPFSSRCDGSWRSSSETTRFDFYFDLMLNDISVFFLLWFINESLTLLMTK